MTSNIEGLIREGIAAFKAGRKDEARVMLSRATELDPRNEQAWLWLSAAVDDVENQQICLENVIAINPKNTRALQGLELIQKEKNSAASRKSTPPSPTPPPASPGVPGSQLFDSSLPVHSSSDVEAGGYHGSGGSVNLPSGHEYDAWVDGLNLGSGGTAGGAATSDPFGFDGPFQQSAPDNDPFAFDEDVVYAESAAFSGDSLSPGYEGSGAADSAFDPYAVPQSSGYDNDYSEPGYSPMGDEPVDEFSDLLDGDGEFSSASPFSEVGPSEAELLSYLEYIPMKIKATHLPGEGPTYPLGIVAGLAIMSGGVVLALLLLIGQLLL